MAPKRRRRGSGKSRIDVAAVARSRRVARHFRCILDHTYTCWTIRRREIRSRRQIRDTENTDLVVI